MRPLLRRLYSCYAATTPIRRPINFIHQVQIFSAIPQPRTLRNSALQFSSVKATHEVLVGGGAAAAAAAADGQSSLSGSRVLPFHSTNRWQLHYNSLKESNQLLVVDFSASWCGPCKFIEPAVMAISNKFTDVEFAKIDVDELPDVAKEFEVQAMPTFILSKNGKVVDKVVGANKDELEQKIAKHRSC